jgi:GT2 family glycosyltransferase
MPIETSICILTFNRCKSITTLLHGIYHFIDDSTEIIVVDNHSNDDTQACIRTTFPQVRYFRTNENIGASGRNVAFENAFGRIIVCLDDDVFGLTEEMISLLHTQFCSNHRLGAVNFRVIDHFTGEVCNWVHHCKPEDFSDKVFLTYEITEGAVAFRKEALDKSGYYDDMYFISHEGPDLAFRIIRAGYDCIYCGDFTVNHIHEDTGRVSWLNYYYDTRNHIYLAVKNLPYIYAMKYLFIGLTSMLIYSIRDGYFRYWVQAIYDGVGNLPVVFKKRNVLSMDLMEIIKTINKNNAPLLYKIRKRFFNNNARL